jgi:single-stranded DNA-binding protein
MMKDIEACFIGRVGTDAVELRTSAGGKLWASFSIVVGDGDEAQWVKLVVFGERAQQLAGHLHKSDRVYVEGRLKLDTWTGKVARSALVLRSRRGVSSAWARLAGTSRPS